MTKAAPKTVRKWRITRADAIAGSMTADYLGLAAFDKLHRQFERAFNTSVARLTGKKKPFRAWRMCCIFVYVESKLFAELKTSRTGRVSRSEGDVCCSVDLANREWFGKTPATHQRLFVPLMVEALEKIANWADRKSAGDDAAIVREAAKQAALAVKAAPPVQTKRVGIYADPFARGGALCDFVDAKPKKRGTSPPVKKRASKPR